ncbi:hypothetical protein ILYODFUR_031515 [Ilyodon furcidens]|uniref:Uncharacterized protein n=2 Tax=Goodeidae TaxID=28758 RepID=A0ABV0UZK9_9TELE
MLYYVCIFGIVHCKDILGHSQNHWLACDHHGVTHDALKEVHDITKSICSPIQTIELMCSSHFNGNRCIKSSTLACRLLLQTPGNQWDDLRTSVNSSMVS